LLPGSSSLKTILKQLFQVANFRLAFVHTAERRLEKEARGGRYIVRLAKECVINETNQYGITISAVDLNEAVRLDFREWKLIRGIKTTKCCRIQSVS